MARKSRKKTGSIIEESLDQALSSRYLAYALSTITQRALPDVRDGMKPVHRRILYAMRQLKLAPETAHKKSARIVGDVMGQYHPHGDQSIYDALVKLAQTFSTRYPLVDGQGNFGNVDGDSPAAMRYTEARMTAAGEMLLAGITENAVDFKPTYNEEDEEPAVLPAGFPNLLANGTQGIAVGMATSVPPHNVAEICDAAAYLIESPTARDSNTERTFKALVKRMPGPDLPTGGIIVEDPDSILNTYMSGKGSFRVRSRWEVEKLARGAWQVVVTEIPYQVQKSRLIEKLAEVIDKKSAPALADVRDESAEDIRIVLEPKSKTLDPALMMESLFKITDLESRTSLNMNVLDARGVPRVMNLREVLQAWLDHRREVLVRRKRFRLDKIEARIEVLDGLMIAFLNLDEVIRIIRYGDAPKAELIEAFKLTERQAEAILNMRLRSLNKLQEIEIKSERDSLEAERTDIRALLKSEAEQWEAVGAQVKELRALYGPKTAIGARRTAFGEVPEIDVDLSTAFITREPVTVVLSKKGWLRGMKGRVEDVGTLKFKDGDAAEFVVPGETTDKFIAVGSNGKFYTLAGDKLPGGRGNGEPIRLLVDLPNDHEVIGLFRHHPERELLVASSEGYGFRVREADVVASTKGGKQVLNVRGAAEAARVVEARGDHLAVIGENRKILIYPLDEVPVMSRGKGVRLQRYKDGGLMDVRAFAKAEGLSFEDKAGRSKAFPGALKEYLGARGQAGRMAPRGFNAKPVFGFGRGI